MRPSKLLVFRLMLVAMGTFAGLVCAELALRLALSRFPRIVHTSQNLSDVFGLVYENIPNFRNVDPKCCTYMTNRWGLQGEDFPMEKPPQEKRLLILGDSIAFGWTRGIQRLEQTAASLIEEGLNGRMPKGGKARVVNCGTLSYNLWDYYFWLHGKGWKFQPDGVVVFLCLNDAAPKALALPLIKPGQKLPLGFRVRGLLLRSRLVWFAVYKWRIHERVAKAWRTLSGNNPLYSTSAEVLRKVDRDTVSAVNRYGKTEGFDAEALAETYREMFQEETWPRALDVLKTIHHDVTSRGMFFRVVIFPIGYQVLPGYKDERPQSLIRSFCRKEGIEYIDLLGPFREAFRRQGKVFIDGDMVHPNPLGHRIAAEQVLRDLEREPVFRRPAPR